MLTFEELYYGKYSFIYQHVFKPLCTTVKHSIYRYYIVDRKAWSNSINDHRILIAPCIPRKKDLTFQDFSHSEMVLFEYSYYQISRGHVTRIYRGEPSFSYTEQSQLRITMLRAKQRIPLESPLTLAHR